MDAFQRPDRRARGSLVWATALLLLPGCGNEEPTSPAPPPSGAVSSATPEATAVGIRILALGGNAVDAAVAISLTLGVTEPSESGLGGTVVMLVIPPGSDPVVIHAPPEVVVSSGPTSFLRPTAVPVLVHAWRTYGSGKVSWRQLVEPARQLAEGGYALGRFRHLMMVKEYRRIEGDSVAAALLLNPDHSIPGEGTLVQLPALAATLQRLAATAPGDLPGGDFADLVAGGLTGLVDAAGALSLATPAEAREEPPLRGTYRGWSVLVPGDPYGGSRLLRALKFLQSAPVAVMKQAGESRTAWLAEALAYAIAPPRIGLDEHRTRIPRLPITVTDAGLRGAALPQRRRPPSLVQPPAPEAQPDSAAGPPIEPDSAAGAAPDTAAGTGTETSHFSVVDATGMAVSVTQSLGGPFGERASHLGFFLARAPEGTNGSPAAGPVDVDSTTFEDRTVPAALEPWSEPVFWSVPTVLARGGEPGLVLGSSGGPRALSAVVQTVIAWVDGGHPVERAIATPRLHLDADTAPRPRVVLEGVIWLDPVRGSTVSLAPWGEGVRQLAARRGFGLGEWDTGLQVLGISPFFGGVQAVAREGDGWAAAADPRRDGVGLVLSEDDVLRAQQDPDGEDLLGGGASPSPAAESGPWN